MRFPLRRVLLGFAVGAAAGWAGGLLRRPTTAPEGSSADEALHLPQEEFGSPAGEEPAEDVAQEPTAPPEAEETQEHAPPRKATPPAVTRPPGSRRTRAAEDNDGASEPATAPAAGEERIKPRRPRAAKKAVADPHVDAAAALREGHAAATERLADAEAEATPPPDLGGPARRRRRPPAQGT
jgi:hypothetical protein